MPFPVPGLPHISFESPLNLVMQQSLSLMCVLSDGISNVELSMDDMHMRMWEHIAHLGKQTS